MGEKFTHVPEEARDFKVDKREKLWPSDETKRRIQTGPSETTAKPEADKQPEATGERIHWHAPDGNVITPEKEEIYRSPETLPEKEPGYGPKASLSDDPGKTAADDQTPTDADDDES